MFYDVAPVPPPHPLLICLTKQERETVLFLDHHYPNYMANADVLEYVPGRDHVHDRQWKHVSVTISNIRKKLGRDAIENLFGEGYRISPAFHARLHEL